MNKKVLASIISLSAVGVLGVGIVCANADKSPVPDLSLIHISEPTRP